MARRKQINNRNGFASPLRARPGMKTVIYQDTTTSTITVSETATTFTYTTGQLLPGLHRTASPTGAQRVLVPRAIFVECIPSGSTSAALPIVQLQVPATWGGNRTSEGFGAQPFKLISAVNPTILKLDWVAMGRVVPYVLRPTSMVDDEDLLSIQGKVGSTTSRTLQLRITTVVALMPQDGIIDVTPTVVPINNINKSLMESRQHDGSCASINTDEKGFDSHP